MTNTDTYRTFDRLYMDEFTPQGREALRRWYRHFRMAEGRSPQASRTIVYLMAHAARMGSSWY